MPEEKDDRVSVSGWFNMEPVVEVAYASRAKARRRLAALIMGLSFIGLGLLLPLLIPERPQRPLPPVPQPRLAIAPAPAPATTPPPVIAAKPAPLTHP